MRTSEPKGRFGCAAVRASESYFSPLAVFLPSNLGPYQLALPIQTLRGFSGSLECATSGASTAGAMTNMSASQRTAAQGMNIRHPKVCLVCNITTENCTPTCPLGQVFSCTKNHLNSLILRTLYFSQDLSSHPRILPVAVGAAKLALPTCTAVAPSTRYSRPSPGLSIPPSPMTGVRIDLPTART